jgi:hypothetical protein
MELFDNTHYTLPEQANDYKRLLVEIVRDDWILSGWSGTSGETSYTMFYAGNVDTNAIQGMNDPGGGIDYYNSIVDTTKMGGNGTIVPNAPCYGSIAIKMNYSGTHGPSNVNDQDKWCNGDGYGWAEDYHIQNKSENGASDYGKRQSRDFSMFNYEHDKLKHYSNPAYGSNPSRAHGPAYGLWKFQIVGKDGRQSFKTFGNIDDYPDSVSSGYYGLVESGGWNEWQYNNNMLGERYKEDNLPHREGGYRRKFTFDITNDAEGIYTHLHNTAYTPTSVVYYVKVEFIGAIYSAPTMEWAYRDLDFDVNNLPELSPQPSNNFLYDFYDQTWYNANKHKIPHVLPRWNLPENEQYKVNSADGKSNLNPESGWDFQAANESPDVASNLRFNGGCWLLPGGHERFAGVTITQPFDNYDYYGYYDRQYYRPPKCHYVPQFNVWIEK